MSEQTLFTLCFDMICQLAIQYWHCIDRIYLKQHGQEPFHILQLVPVHDHARPTHQHRE